MSEANGKTEASKIPEDEDRSSVKSQNVQQKLVRLPPQSLAAIATASNKPVMSANRAPPKLITPGNKMMGSLIGMTTSNSTSSPSNVPVALAVPATSVAAAEKATTSPHIIRTTSAPTRPILAAPIAKNHIDRQPVSHQTTIERKSLTKAEGDHHNPASAFRPTILSRPSANCVIALGSGQQKSSTSYVGVSGVNGQNLPDDSKPTARPASGEASTQGTSAPSSGREPTDLDLFKPLDGKLTEDVDCLTPVDDNCLKVVKNEHGLIEISRNQSLTGSSAADSEQLTESKGVFVSSFSDSEDSSSVDLTCHEAPLEKSSSQETSPEVASINSGAAKHRDDDILCCQGCGCYGMAGDFLTSAACNESCQNRIAQLGRERQKKERELLVQRQRREAKRKELQEAKKAAELEELKRDVKSTKRLSEEESDDDDDDDEGYEAEEDSLFTWGRYLDATNAKGAPAKLFDCGIPTSPNPFRTGMKLEAVDPEHPSLFCCVTVVEVKGYRIRLRFDGWSKSYDFWRNADSCEIFPHGWCEQHKQKLEPPRDYQPLPFNWRTYMSGLSDNFVLAPKSAFKERPKASSQELLGWQIGAKLEAIDKQNTSLICVATAKNVLDGRILIHFDGWELDYDYWVKPDSPYVKPKGWCDKQGLSLNKPKGYRGDFKWDRYLAETGCRAVPENAFKERASETTLFRRGWKVELVDSRNPSLVRVATVEDIALNQLKMHFDGWPDVYNILVDDESPDLHPPLWCAKTGHPLEPPLTTQEVKRLQEKSECQTPGCGGVGHIKGHLHSSHNVLVDCPYAPKNIRSLEPLIPDRLMTPDKSLDADVDLVRGSRKRKRPKFFDENEEEEEEEDNRSLNASASSLGRDEEAISSEPLIRDNVFRPTHITYPPPPQALVPLNWNENAGFLRNSLKTLRLDQVSRWSPKQVASFVTGLLQNDTFVGAKLMEEEIDGEAFLMLNQLDLTKILGLKLGPALKIINTVILIRSARW